MSLISTCAWVDGYVHNACDVIRADDGGGESSVYIYIYIYIYNRARYHCLMMIHSVIR